MGERVLMRSGAGWEAGGRAIVSLRRPIRTVGSSGFANEGAWGTREPGGLGSVRVLGLQIEVREMASVASVASCVAFWRWMASAVASAAASWRILTDFLMARFRSNGGGREHRSSPHQRSGLPAAVCPGSHSLDQSGGNALRCRTNSAASVGFLFGLTL
jgi:hypothetical protein